VLRISFYGILFSQLHFAIGDYESVLFIFDTCSARVVASLEVEHYSHAHALRLPEMLSPRGQSGLEAKILASASVSASKLWPRPGPWPQTFGLGLASVCSRRTNNQEEMLSTII